MNAHLERLNRTIEEEFIDYHQELLITPNEFNRQLIPWLIWYNAERPHWSLELKSPVQFLLKEHPSLCKTWPALYKPLQIIANMTRVKAVDVAGSGIVSKSLVR